MGKVVQVDGLIHMFKDMRARLNPRDYHSLLEYDTRDTMLLNMVQMLQLSDGIELVFCKECKYCVNGQCWKTDGLDKLDGNVADNDFCSRGERREP